MVHFTLPRTVRLDELNPKHTWHYGVLFWLLFFATTSLSAAQTPEKTPSPITNVIATPSAVLFARIVDELATVTAAVDQEVPCKKPSDRDFDGVCDAINLRVQGTDIIGFHFEKLLWELACADAEGMLKLYSELQELKKNKEANKEAIVNKVKAILLARAVASKKIQAFWLLYREDFACRGYTEVTVTAGNVLNFAMDKGFPAVVSVLVKKYGIDVNFRDPNDDGATIMDFLRRRSDWYKSAGYTLEVMKYERVYGILAAHGAKHGKDLP